MDATTPGNIMNWVTSHLDKIVNVAVLTLITWILLRLIRLLANRFEKNLLEKKIEPERYARMITIEHVIITSLNALVLVIALISLLGILGFNLAPFLASAGIAGLAVSLGAQSLIKDFIGGFLIVLENQFGVGDLVQVGDVRGTVEAITLRTVTVRDYSGGMNVVPNGEIRVVTNFSRDWARARLDLNVPFDADIGGIVQALETAAGELENEEAIREKWIEKPTVTAYSSANNWSVQVRLTGRVQTGTEFVVETYLRQYVLNRFRERGISLALPSQAIHLQPAGDSDENVERQ